MSEVIRVVIVDDSPLACKLLTTIINGDPQLIVAGVGRNGQEGVELVERLKPDLVLMDIHMPVMDGFEATKQIMAACPRPILIVSSSAMQDGRELVFRALAQGALDVMEKTSFELASDPARAGLELVGKIKMLAGVKVVRRPLGGSPSTLSRPLPEPSRAAAREVKMVGIAASTGGPHAIATILKTLPRAMPCGILLVQHISPGFESGLVDWLAGEGRLPVRLATHEARIEPGVAYLAPTGRHLRVKAGSLMRLTDEPPIHGQRPSADALFASLAEVYGPQAIGVVLSGIGSDGTEGLVQLHAAGGLVVAQNEASCVVFGMPKSAIERGVVDHVLPVEQIAAMLLKRCGL